MPSSLNGASPFIVPVEAIALTVILKTLTNNPNAFMKVWPGQSATLPKASVMVSQSPLGVQCIKSFHKYFSMHFSVYLLLCFLQLL